MTVIGYDERIERTPEEEREHRESLAAARDAQALESLRFIASHEPEPYCARGSNDAAVLAYLARKGWAEETIVENPAGRILAGVKNRHEWRVTEAGHKALEGI
jgi:hypothetical protein